MCGYDCLQVCVSVFEVALVVVYSFVFSLRILVLIKFLRLFCFADLCCGIAGLLWFVFVNRFGVACGWYVGCFIIDFFG